MYYVFTFVFYVLLGIVMASCLLAFVGSCAVVLDTVVLARPPEPIALVALAKGGAVVSALVGAALGVFLWCLDTWGELRLWQRR